METIRKSEVIGMFKKKKKKIQSRALCGRLKCQVQFSWAECQNWPSSAKTDDFTTGMSGTRRLILKIGKLFFFFFWNWCTFSKACHSYSHIPCYSRYCLYGFDYYSSQLSLLLTVCQHHWLNTGAKRVSIY